MIYFNTCFIIRVADIYVENLEEKMKLYSKIKKKKIKKQVTRKYVIQNVTPEFKNKFAQGQISYTRIYNVVLKYLYKNYGAKRLNCFMPMLGMKNGKKNTGFYVFVGNIADIVIERLDKGVIFDRQSINVFIESIVRIFNEYRKKQRKVQHCIVQHPIALIQIQYKKYAYNTTDQ